MSITGLDHIAFPTSDAERLIALYKKLGVPVVDADAWREGRTRIFALVLGQQKINIHPPAMVSHRGEPWYLRAPAAEPGCADLCVTWDSGPVALLDFLAERGIEVVLGPVGRTGGRGQGAAEGLSVYIRDPDSNLLEFICYPTTRAG